MTMHERQLPKQRRAGGFTLIELLLAIAIVAVLSLALFSTISTAFHAKRTAENALEPVTRAGIAMEVMSRDFASTLMPAGDVTLQDTSATGSTGATGAATTPPQPLAYEFQGVDGGDAGDDVWFYAATDTPMIPFGGPTQIQNAGSGVSGGAQRVGANFANNLGGVTGGTEPVNADLRRVEYTCEMIDGENCLVRRVQSNLLADQEPDLDAEMEVLCRGVNLFKVEYYDGLDWQTQWDSTVTDPVNGIPVAVRITLELNPPTIPGQAIDKDQVKRIVKVVSMACYVDLTLTNSSTETGQ